jgi:nicotinamidase-related amidase
LKYDNYTNPDRRHSALIIIDVQQDFALRESPTEIPGTLQAAHRIKPLIRVCRKLCHPIIHVVRLYRADGSNADLCRKKEIELGKQIVLPGSIGAELLDALKPSSSIKLESDLLLSGSLQQIGPMEWIMYKPRWGAFYNTLLEKRLHDLGVNTVLICGCNFPNCPRTTIYEASERDFRAVLIRDGTSAVYDAGLRELKNIGVSVMSIDKCIAWLNHLKVERAAR